MSHRIGPERATRTIPLAAEKISREFAVWAQAVEDAIGLAPDFSVISTSDGPESAGTYKAYRGAMRSDIGSSSTRLWIKAEDSTLTGGWRTLARV